MVFGFCTSSKVRIRFPVASFGAAGRTVHGGGLAQLDVQYHIDDCCARSWAHLVLHGKFAFKTFDLQDPRMEHQRATQGGRSCLMFLEIALQQCSIRKGFVNFWRLFILKHHYVDDAAFLSVFFRPQMIPCPPEWSRSWCWEPSVF